MKTKISYFILIVKTKIELLKLKLMNYRNSIVYLLIIICTFLFSALIPNVINLLQSIEKIPIYELENAVSKYYDLYINSGISLLGLAALIFTLKTFKQQTLNEYMNSVFQRIFSNDSDYYIQYIYLCFIAFLFLLMPNTKLFALNLSYFISFYYISIASILFILGMELYNISHKMNKTYILKEIEKRIIVLYDMGEKIGKMYSKFENKNGLAKTSSLFFIEQMNRYFATYTQCINLITKKSFDDPIIFGNSMDVLLSITEVRLKKRKNKFNENNVPLLCEIIPNEDNDVFIENYLLEYLDDYSKLSLEQRNRDNLGTIERMYRELLLAGKDNRHKNSQNLELTIKIIMIYYLRTIKHIVSFDNENMLFQTINIFKELFIINGKYFSELVDKDFCENIKELSQKALEKESLMNYRNIQGLLSIGLYSVLFNLDLEYREIYLDEIFKTYKHNLQLLYKNKLLIKEYDGGRLCLHYIFQGIEPLSILSIYRELYNNNISSENEFINLDLLLKNDFNRILTFLNDKGVFLILSELCKNKYYVTIKSSINSICEFLLQISSTIYTQVDDNEIKNEYLKLFKNTLETYNIYTMSLNVNNSHIRYELDRFYLNNVAKVSDYLIVDEKLQTIVKNVYLDSLLKIYNKIEEELEFYDLEDYYKSIYHLSNDEKIFKENIIEFLNKLKEIIGNEIIIRKYIEFKRRINLPMSLGNKEIHYIVADIIKEQIDIIINEFTSKELKDLYSVISSEKFDSQLKKNEILTKIRELLE